MDIQEIGFGDFCTIEQKRYVGPNEFYCYKVVGRKKSNVWTDVPVDVNNGKETRHDYMDDVVTVVCNNLDDRTVYQFRVSDLASVKKAQAVQEGFVLVPAKNVKYFSNDGENYEIHDTLAEAKHEAECAIEHFSERLADQLCDPRDDGNFQDVGYGIVLGTSGYSVDHVVTQEDVENGEYGYEVGTEIMSLFLVEAQEPAND